MNVDSVRFKGHRCFSKEFAGFDSIKPINVLIGRNNSGKSHMLDFAEALCGKLPRRDWEAEYETTLDEATLRQAFSENTSGGELGGNHWRSHGAQLVGARVRLTITKTGDLNDIETMPGSKVAGHEFTHLRKQKLLGCVSGCIHELTGREFRRLAAERNILPEALDTDMTLLPGGAGATRVITRIIVNERYDRDLIQVKLFDEFRHIFGTDGAFEEIEVRQNESGSTWEVFLREDSKGLVPLSRSGSGLKTILLVLMNLIVIPELENKRLSRYAFGFEELENNLHPAILRRLFAYLEEYAVKHDAKIFLTTHSSVALDVFALSKNAQIIHVANNGSFSIAKPISAHLERIEVVSELGAKPSDLLQANGIIWVEGPSDRIYLNHFIELFSDGRFREGRDYQCAYYGGALLAQIQITADDPEVAKLVNLFNLNHNLFVVCDGDRTAMQGEGSTLKARVSRVVEEVKKIPSAGMWVTAAKEIENYLPGSVLKQIFDLDQCPDPGQYDRFFPSESKDSKADSFAEKSLKRKSLDKVDLALRSLPLLTKDSLSSRFDLAQQMGLIIDKIANWNK
jgi:putative ATP-dependent endonuclease of OLD family